MIRRNFLSLLFGLVSAPAAVAAIYPDGSRRNAKRYDVDFVA